MIVYYTGNLLEANAEALVNTVNTVGIMGKGIALQFKKAFPNNYKKYLEACRKKSFNIGDLILTEENSLLFGNRIIINFPTKTDWRKPSEYSYIEKGLMALKELIVKNQIKSIAIPPLGSGNGGLEWSRVKNLMETYLSNLDCLIQIFEPSNAIQEILIKERIKLTPARAMLLAVLYDLVKSGEFVSEFASEKVAYFLQKFGGKKAFNLEFKPNFYGPYSGKVKHVLYHLNGSYVNGYSSKDKKPFDEIGVLMNSENDVLAFLNQAENEEYLKTVNKTLRFLDGFYSSFGLELLSTIDYLIIEKKCNSIIEVTKSLEEWSDRKKTMFASNYNYVEIAFNHLKDFDSH